MIVLAWNMARNTVARSKAKFERTWHYFAALDPDIALLQEASTPDWVHDHWAVHAPSSHWWGSVVAVKRGIEFRPEQGGVPHDLATGTVVLPDGGELLVISVYAPAVEATQRDLAGRDPSSVALPGRTKTWANDAAYAVARDMTRGRRFLAAGDWNISPTIWDERHRGTNGRDFFARIAQDGWVDCYRRFHEAEGRTWFRKGNGPYQFDHAFSDPDTASTLSFCEIDANPADPMGISDHAPLILSFGL